MENNMLTFTYEDLKVIQQRFVKAGQAGVDFTIDEINLLSRIEKKLGELKFMEAADEYVKKVTGDDLPIFQVPRAVLLGLYTEFGKVKASKPVGYSWEEFFELYLGDNPFVGGKETVPNFPEVLQKRRARETASNE